MICAVFTGTELLQGGVANTNLCALSRELAKINRSVKFAITAGDTAQEISRALAVALKNSDTVIVCGGLGSTRDDLTLDTVAHFFGLQLEQSEEMAGHVRLCWQKRHAGAPPRSAMRQARLPLGARFIPNDNGSACGIAFETVYDQRRRDIYLLPGPPREFEPMTRDHLLGFLPHGGRESLLFLAPGMGELDAQKLTVEALGEDNDNVEVGYCARPEGTRVWLSCETPGLLERVGGKTLAAFGTRALPPGELDIAAWLLEQLRARHRTLATAESCTGGWVGKMLTDIPGASDSYLGGAVCYSNRLKTAMLGVPETLLNTYGAVSAQCAEALARGAQKNFGAECAIAITGIAGPDGGSEEKPVGTVFIAAACGEEIEISERHFYGNRLAIRERAAAAALVLLKNLLDHAR